MKELQSLLDKIKVMSVNSQDRSVIEVDLMLDYTRKIYEILLKERATITTEKPEKTTPWPAIDNNPKEILSDTRSDENDKKIIKNETAESAGKVVAPTFEVEKNKQDIPAKEITLSAEQAYGQHNSISFEPPHPAEEQPVSFEEGIEEDKPEQNTFPVKNIPEPVTEADVLADYAQIFHYNSPANESVQKGDIRKHIGINDKYLFLNELFYSRKREYENTLDKINEIIDYKQALNWVKEEVAPVYKWDNEDETVLDFYSTLEKYFSER